MTENGPGIQSQPAAVAGSHAGAADRRPRGLRRRYRRGRQAQGEGSGEGGGARCGPFFIVSARVMLVSHNA